MPGKGEGMYNVVVIGAGTAGLVTAAGTAGLGGRVALVERHRMGGDCLNTGCVPSKALIASARAAQHVREGRRWGLESQEPRFRFEDVMERVRERRARLAPHDSQERFESLGVDVFRGAARFVSPREVEVGGQRLRGRNFVIASGSRAGLPPIEGLAEARPFTNETIFDELRERPARLIVLGGGPIGCEMAQAFARLGTRVTLIEGAAQLLPREDPDAGAIVAHALEQDGVTVLTGVRVTTVATDANGISVTHERGRTEAHALLVATGRSPNVEGLGLDAAGIAHDDDGIRVDDSLRTTNRRVFAAGDVASRYKFTHAADALARTVIQNALFLGRRRASRLVIPWCTFTSPEVAHVGLTSSEARERGAQTITVPLTDIDRAVVDEDATGFIRIHHDSGRIVGATIVSAAAGELIGTVAYAVQTGGTLANLSSVVFPYPTLSLALRQAGDAYQRTRLTPGVRTMLKYYFRWSG